MINNDMIMKTMLISTLMIQNDKNDDNFFSFKNVFHSFPQKYLQPATALSTH